MPTTESPAHLIPDGRALFARWLHSSPARDPFATQRLLRDVTLAALVFVLALSIVLRTPGRRLATCLPGGSDSWMFVGVLQWNTEALATGRSWVDVWRLPVLYPEDNMLASSEHMLGGTVLFAPLWGLVGNPILAFNLWLIVLAALNYFTAWAVARRLLGSGLGAILTATLFTFGFVRLCHHGHAHLWPHFPTPLLFLAAVRLCDDRSWRWPLLGGACLAGQLYLSIYLGYMAALLLAIMLGTLACCQPERFRDGRFWLRLLVAGLIAAVPVVPLAFPYYRAAQRWGCWSWGETVLYIPRFKDLVLRSQREQCVWMGWLVGVLCLLGGAILVRQWRGRSPRDRFWLLCCCTVPVVVLAVIVNAFQSYRLLYEVVPGFRALRCPARMTLAVYWPCGLLAGWALTHVLHYLYPQTCWRRLALGLGIVLLVLSENAMPFAWTDARLPDEELYRQLVRSLPEGALVDFPLQRPGEDWSWLQARRFACARLAGWRPMLNAFTSKMPAWYDELNRRQLAVSTSEQAASLLGEMRLRGLRFVLLHKDQLPDQRWRLWQQARSDVHILHDDARVLLLDLRDAAVKTCLPPAWAILHGPGPAAIEQRGNGSVLQLKPGADAAASLRPLLPLPPGRYRAVFRLESTPGTEVYCAAVRVPSEERLCLRSVRPVAGPASLELAFDVPAEKGPECMLDFRVYRQGIGACLLRDLTLERVDPQK